MLGIGQHAHLWLPQPGSATTPVPPAPPAPEPVVELLLPSEPALPPLPPLLLDVPPLSPAVAPAAVVELALVPLPPVPPIPVAVAFELPFVALFAAPVFVPLLTAEPPVEVEPPAVFVALPLVASSSLERCVLPQPSANASKNVEPSDVKEFIGSGLVKSAPLSASTLQGNEGVPACETFRQSLESHWGLVWRGKFNIPVEPVGAPRSTLAPASTRRGVGFRWAPPDNRASSPPGKSA